MKVSLLITTYNWPEALHLTLASTAAQSRLPDEILIADDGSTDDTRQLINFWRKLLPVPVHHIWQEDQGFRLAAVRNKGIFAATGDYLVQVDGDIIFRRHFIRDHIHFARPGSYANGSRVMLGPCITRRLISRGQIAIPYWNRDFSNWENGFRMPILSKPVSWFAQNKPRKIHGCNMAFWTEDLRRVNGYNEEMTGWGYEDNELAVRLWKAGLHKQTLKFSGIAYHLHHNARSHENVERNRQILLQAIGE